MNMQKDELKKEEKYSNPFGFMCFILTIIIIIASIVGFIFG